MIRRVLAQTEGPSAASLTVMTSAPSNTLYPEIAESQRQLTTITQDQARLRANLRETPSDSDLHKRYLTRLGEQETEIEKYQAGIKQLQGVEHRQQKEFEDFMANFTAE